MIIIERPYADLDSWVAYLSHVQPPVLRHTVQELEQLRANAERVNGRVLSSIILQDPMMTLRVLAYIESHRRKSQNADITTIERALMMIGIDPFFREFEFLPLVEDSLKPHPQALLGLLKVIGRARHACHWAREWAVIRHDLDVDEITVATLLHDIAEILMWCFAPSLALQVRDQQTKDRTLRSNVVQQEVYNVQLHKLQLALARAWHLPQLLTALMDRAKADHPRVRNVTLAVDLARHSSNGWDDPALPDDFAAIENLLHISHESLLRKLGLDIAGGSAGKERGSGSEPIIQ
ncbi:MAG: HDOD domain-containing protein [Rhodocyclaceae bacterium]|jgi:HD-like signal output (HDOD) protein|nr:HDOD domain-containing protein [Rhodocyclaceae bacterium]MBK6553446.1 HDOD domain-containing protein [Rhodocyclaceae bacterium]MBK9311277.1 HDOD domain-containing protein [Rhodocyclaceae bacterium]MBK9953784.1 HDOD domain-containing protein [Rhodocyclaceae bacterium]